ncbi:MAG: tol-pal system protein YbgF [Burkholderiaceae bacterium]
MTAARFRMKVAARAAGALLVAAAALTAATPAHALFGDDEARKAILDLRKKVDEQNQALAQKDAELAARMERLEAANRAQLEFANTIDALKREIAQLRGQVEQLAHEVATLQKRNRDLYGDLDARLKKLEPVTVTVDGKPAQVERGEQAAFDVALAQFRASDFKGAIASLQTFLARYPQSAYAASAHYWLGSSYFALKDYKAAIAALQVIAERHPDSPRTPEALLTIAASQIELNDKKSARTTLARIIKDYPDTEAAKLAKERLPSTALR